MEPFKIQVDNKEYTVRPIEEPDQVLYEIYQDDLITTIGLNENAAWEATTDIDNAFVQQIGVAIEDHEA